MARTSWCLSFPSSAQQGASHAASCRKLFCAATACQGEAFSCSPFLLIAMEACLISAVPSLVLLWQTLTFPQ